VHSAEYIQSLKRPHDLARYLEFEPLAFAPAGMTDGAVLRPFRTATGGTLLAARLALQHGMAVNLGGGYHHAGPGEGGGFCIYADMAIAIRRLQAEGAVRRALIVDVDVHQGNGTALCFENDDTVYTFDIHQDGIYPIPKERNDVDIALPAGTGDSSYLAVLRERLPAAFDASRPDIVILQAGVDVLAGDPLADFEISPEGVIERDATVFAEARRRGIPIVMVLGGGYSKQAWEVQYRSIRNLIECYGRKVRPM
jgi:histone deacetylase 11